jgi:hypothetical protein
MKMTQLARLVPRAGFLACLAVLSLGSASNAFADMVLLADTSMVRGSNASADFSFVAPGSGTVTATLMNQSWGPVQPLSNLSFMANTGTNVLSSWQATVPSTTESFQVGAGTYFAHIMASATGTLDIGVYSLNLSFVPSAVPLPASVMMLLFGLIALYGLSRVLRGSAWLRLATPSELSAS